MSETNSWLATYRSREDLKVYGSNALGLFALALRFGIDDLASVAADAITDGNDDKKCDIVYVNTDEGYCVVCQCYETERSVAAAPANKASDLNTAISWLLHRPVEDLPEKIASAADQLQTGIAEGKISNLFIWYVHNLPESQNVKDELITVEATAEAALRQLHPSREVSVSATEVGSKVFTDWYREIQSPILVSERFSIDVDYGYAVRSDDWQAYVTTVPATFLHTVYKNYGTKLFSANVRDYLGSRSTDSNINNGIVNTLTSSPANFWIFNNGLTVLVNDFEEPADDRPLYIHGMSIVNGAQTTGAIGTLAAMPDPSASVSVRFVRTTNTDVIHSIVQYNNSQNKITASDFRSTDRVQTRLKNEFLIIPDAEYDGGRADNPQ